MCPNTKFVHFTMEWRIRWSEYDSIRYRAVGVSKEFSTAYNNVPLQWRAQIRQNPNDKSKVDFYVYYTEGPMEKVAGVEHEIGIVKSDGTMRVIKTMLKYSVDRGHSRGNESFEENHSAAVRIKYGLNDTDRVAFQITVKIPIDTFSYAMPAPMPKPTAAWMVDLFKAINDPNNSSFSDAKLISRDDVVFYCHKNVIGAQSEPLATILRDPLEVQRESDHQHPPATNTNCASRKAVRLVRLPKRGSNGLASFVINDQSKKKGEYKFPTMAGAALKSIIEYLYTGKATMFGLSAPELIEVADAAEQFALKSLKELCSAELWKRVVDGPQTAFQVVRFADLHDDMKWLKRRAFDVLVELDKLTRRTLAIRFGGGRPGMILHEEFDDYLADRLGPYVNASNRYRPY